MTSRGVELFALCNKREARVESVAKAQVKNKLMGEKFEAQGKRYLAELRRAALIEWKEPQEPIKEVKGKKGVRPSKRIECPSSRRQDRIDKALRRTG